MSEHESGQSRVVLVTGAAAGIGAACAVALAGRGDVIIAVDRDEAMLAKQVAAQRALGHVVDPYVVDVSDSQAVNDLVDTIVSTRGRLDCAVNNAGISGAQLPIGELSDEEWAETRGINFDGVFYCLRAELRAMQDAGSGAIVNMASILSVVAWPSAAAYTAAKHGVLGLTRSAAVDYAGQGLRINAVGPGFIGTELVRSALDEATLAQLAGLHPRGSMGAPEDVAALVAFLLSPESVNINGAYFATDGGFTAR
ncbi:MAG: SDR family NAD(P)-dependent oxidoreductase [Actinomycetes bacterium]